MTSSGAWRSAQDRQLWEQAGRPAGGSDPYIDQARELVAIEDRQKQTTKPLAAAERTGP
jgi:hypothetical protein